MDLSPGQRTRLNRSTRTRSSGSRFTRTCACNILIGSSLMANLPCVILMRRASWNCWLVLREENLLSPLLIPIVFSNREPIDSTRIVTPSLLGAPQKLEPLRYARHARRPQGDGYKLLVFPIRRLIVGLGRPARRIRLSPLCNASVISLSVSIAEPTTIRKDPARQRTRKKCTKR